MSHTAQLELWLSAVDAGAQLHLLPGHPPLSRSAQSQRRISREPIAEALIDELRQLCLTEQQRDELEAAHEVVTEYGFADRRYRAVFSRHSGGLHVIFGRLPESPECDPEHGRSEFVHELASRRSGLVAFAGDAEAENRNLIHRMSVWLTENRSTQIVVVADRPGVNAVDGPGLIHELEIGRHVDSAVDGIRLAVAMEADVLVVPLTADAKTMGALLAAAEGPMLVLAAVPGSGVREALEQFRTLAGSRAWARLAYSLQMLIVQTQLITPAGKRCAAELLTSTDALSHALTTGDLAALDGSTAERLAAGMRSIDHSLRDLLSCGQLSEADVRSYADDPEWVLAASAAAHDGVTPARA